MQSQNPLFDDFARVAGGALGALSGLKAEVEALIRQQMERWMAGMDMVPREEFEAVRAMAIKAREQQDALAARVAALEAQLAGEKPAKAAAPAAKPAAKKPRATKKAAP
ncbi:MAG: accessory factor UbiK family protein [Actinomycetota bacterium]